MNYGDAAHVLWTEGHLNEALRVMRDGVHAELERIGKPLRRFAKSDAEVAMWLEWLHAQDPPTSRERSRLFFRLDAMRLAIGQRRSRRKSVIYLSLLMAVLLLIPVIALSTPLHQTRVRVQPSQWWSPNYLGHLVLDDDPSTQWISRHQAAWLDVHFGPSRRIETFRVVNGGNWPFERELARSITVSFFSGERKLAEAPAQFDGTPFQRLEWRAPEEPIDRVRIDIRSSFGTCVSLASVEWIEAR